MNHKVSCPTEFFIRLYSEVTDPTSNLILSLWMKHQHLSKKRCI